MQKTESREQSKSVRRRAMPSTTLNRRYVKRPTSSSRVAVSVKQNAKTQQTSQAQRSSQIQHFNNTVSSTSIKKTRPAKTTEVGQVASHPMHETAKARMKVRSAAASKPSTGIVSTMTAKELKDQAIRKALENAAKDNATQEQYDKQSKKSFFGQFRLGRVMLALTCTAVAVFAIVYFVNLNMPDISLRVAAMQTGIEASYPNYIPRDYTLSEIASEDGRVTLKFVNSTNSDGFTLVEEKSSWDSSALQNNYVRDEFPESYSTIREQGLTIYVYDSNAAWVNGGVVYKLTAPKDTLTKKQIKTIATSM
ncbi:hypothetical protein IKE98_03615 [Candidatus Saccharibacteria bacterium]|nr:hypothetical protein [Candidatus Saccharibacteria bacterium]